MSESSKSSFKLDLNNLGERLTELIHEGNVRRLIVRRGDDVIAEFPLTAAVIGTLIAPVLAAIAGIAAFVTDCTIEVEHTSGDDKGTPSA